MATDAGTVFVVDDDQAVRTSLEMLIKTVNLRVACFASAHEFLAAYDPGQPGCLVLDVRMPGMSGLELQKSLRDHHIDIPVIIVTGHGDVPVAVKALKDGAFEFLEKPFSRQMLLEHIRAALNLDATQRAHRAKQHGANGKLASLTPRERQVMELVVTGKVNKQIAAKLGLSKKTVEVHRAHVMQKLQVESLAELVELVVTNRLGDKSEAPPLAE